MSNNNAENFRFKITNLAENKSSNKKQKPRRNLRPPTLKQIFDVIDTKDYDVVVKEELKKSASEYPHHGLQRWIDNFDQFLMKARRDARDRIIKESNDKIKNKNNIETQSLVEEEEDFEEGEEVVDMFPDDYDPTA